MKDWTPVKERLTAVMDRLSRADQKSGSLTALLAVSKTFPPQAVLAAAEMGQRAFGEHYAQEGCDKIEWFRPNAQALPHECHFIGPLQSNKTKIVAEHFDWVESIDRVKIAQRLNDQRPMTKDKLNVLIEVNIDGEATKSGVKPEDLDAILEAVAALPNHRLRGL